MDTTAKAAVQWLKDEVHKGGNANTLGSYATAVRRVLRATHGDRWADQDLAQLDVALHITNFGGESDLEPVSTAVYSARFRSAINRFLTHIESNASAGPSVQILDIPYPLRDGLVMSFKVPVDLSREEAERLGAFFLSLSK